MSQQTRVAGSGLDQGTDQLLSVRVGDQEFALAIAEIREIRGWIATTALPHAPPYIKGMIDLRGTALAIVDLAARLGLPTRDPTPASVVVVVEWKDRTVGLMVDAVSDIITVTPAMRQETPATGETLSRSHVENLIMTDRRIIGILSLAAVIPQEPMPLDLQSA